MYPVGYRSLQFLLASITKLIPWESRMKLDPMPALERLSNLRSLNMCYEAYCGSQMVCSPYGFPKLETLQLGSLMHVRTWVIEKGSMPTLKNLHIERMKDLKMIPEGLKFVTTIKELSTTHMDSSFCEKLRVKNGIEGRDSYKGRHIPSILIISR